MGEAKRRRALGEFDYWYHGTDEHFTQWASPPAKTKYKIELYPHPFLSLSKDKELAQNAGKNTGGLCRSKILLTAKVLDLRYKSADSMAHWEMVRSSTVGKHHALIQSFESWVQACTSGEVLRLHTSNEELLSRLGRLQAIYFADTSPIQEKALAHLEVQNFTRRWINDVILPAYQLGYDAVICAEIDRYRTKGAKACVNLYAFSPQALTAPDWLAIPNESLMLS